MTEERTAPPAACNRTDVLNVLRVVATMFVFLLHGRAYIHGINDVGLFFGILSTPPAWAGVWMLFFLSGYLMQKGFDAGRYVVFGQPGPKWKRYFGFMGKRLVKILPAYYIYLLLFFVLRESTFPFSNPLIMLQLLTCTFNGNGGISGMGHLWYISLAVWLYTLAPFFAYLIDKMRGRSRILPLVVLILLTLCGLGARPIPQLLGGSWYDWCYTFLPMNLDLFFGGMLAAAVTYDRVGCGSKKARTVMKATAAALFVVLAVSNCFVYWKEWYGPYQYVYPTLYLVICSYLCFAFDGQGLTFEKPTAAAVRKNPLRLIDAFSPLTYAFYVFHIMSFRFLDVNLRRFAGYEPLPTVVRWLLFFALSFLLTLLFAWLYTKMMSAFRAKPKKPAPPAAA